MTIDSRSIRDAWNRIPSPGAAGREAERFTGERIERILQIVIGLGSLALGVQALLAAVQSLSQPDAPHIAMMVLVFLPLACMLIACAAGTYVRQAGGGFAVSYMLALLLWPVVADPSHKIAAEQPWIFFLVNIGVAAAIIAFPVPLQFIWAAALPLVYGYVRLVQGEFAMDFWIVTGFDVTFTLILGLVLVSLGWMFRQVGAGVDDTRAATVATYTAAAAATAAEEERTALAALMHDSVLAALIAAERAETERERDLAVAMAREALTRLANTEGTVSQEGSDAPVSTVVIVAELRRALSELGADAIVENRSGTVLVPGKAARALVLAARQAIGNAMTHAAGRGLHVVVDTVGGVGPVTITVTDAGRGFVLEEIGEDRLGIRASIVARMAAVAGFTEIVSGETGTTVVLGWGAE
ncbi:MAG: ATP-binding protein [Microbacterium sp.]